MGKSKGKTIQIVLDGSDEEESSAEEDHEHKVPPPFDLGKTQSSSPVRLR